VTARPLNPRSVTRSASPFDQRPLSPRVTWATAVRVLSQLRRDPRTIVLMLVVPSLLLTLFRYVFFGQEATFDRVGGPLVGLFPFIVMFLITSITMLRERTTGTLERLMTMPLSKLDLLAGYGIAFALVAAVQAIITSAVAFGLLGLDVEGSVAVVVALAVCNALLGVALGLLASAFAQSEFQAVQFMPAFVLPQILLCGLLVQRELMHEVLEWISVFLPLTWAYDGLARAVAGGDSALIARDVAIVLGVTVLALSLGAATLRRRTP
jgi:ABC-2 type transport system permease protein